MPTPTWKCSNAKKKLPNISNEKKRSEETQTLCAGCSKAEPKIFALLQMVTTFTYKPSL